MHFKRTTLFLSLAAAAGCTNAVDSNGSLEPATSAVTAELSASNSLALQNVASANPKVVGMSSPNILSPQLIESPVAQGSFAVENPQTVTLPDGTTATISVGLTETVVVTTPPIDSCASVPKPEPWMRIVSPADIGSLRRLAEFTTASMRRAGGSASVRLLTQRF